jgi:hypothetical protein
MQFLSEGKMFGRIITVVALIITVYIPPARAQELSALGGWMKDYTQTYEQSYSWQIEYREGLGEHFAYSITYLNEGHVTNHHRDGHAAQLWLRTNLFDRRLSLAAGAGPFYYYDTTRASAGANWSNDHSWGALMSLSATWYTSDRWFLDVRANWNQAVTSFDTVSLLAGIGYQLAPPPSPGPLAETPPQRHEDTKNEVTLFLGRTIVNSFGSEFSVARSIEYRRVLSPYIDWTLSWIYEGETDVLRRHGLITQLWAVRSFFDDRFSCSIGGGAYFALTHKQDQQGAGSDDERVSAIVTLSGNYRIFQHWGIRISWDRIVTNYDRDTDVILGGIGYHF